MRPSQFAHWGWETKFWHLITPKTSHVNISADGLNLGVAGPYFGNTVPAPWLWGCAGQQSERNATIESSWRNVRGLLLLGQDIASYQQAE